MFTAARGGFNYLSASANDPYWSSVSLLENFEIPQTSLLDSSTNNFTLTRQGASTTPIRPSLRTPFASGAGGSMYWDGTASWIEMPASTAWSMGTGNFTFEAWVYVTNFSVNFGGYMPIVGWNGGSWNIFRVRPTAMNFQTNTPSNLDYNAAWPSTMVINTWYHVALVRTSTTSVTAYLNGVAGTPVTINANATFGANTILQVGYKSDPGYWWGYISNWRLVKGTAVYTSNFTPSTTPLTAISGTSGLLNFTNQGLYNNYVFVDSSNSSSQQTTTGSVRFSGYSPFGNTYPGSIYNNGSSGIVSPSVSGNLVTTNFTWECWVNFSSLAGNSCLIGSGTSSTNRTMLYYDTTNGIRYVVTRTTDQVSIQQGSTTGWSTGTWYHVAVVRNGNNYNIYRNGTSIASGTSAYAQSDLSAGLSLGYSNAGGTALTGYITNARVVNGTAVYTSTFTPSTIPLTNISGTVYLQLAQGAYQDVSPGNQTITGTAVGSTNVTTQQKKFGTQSMSLVSNNYQIIDNSTSLQFGTGDFTIELWIYRSPASVEQNIIAKNNGLLTGWMLRCNASNQLVWLSSGAATKTSTTTIPATTWTYVAITRTGTTAYMFINGTLEGSSFTDSSNYNQTNNLLLGSANGQTAGFSGYLDDVRITKGVCRYTATFTAPTAAFPTS